LKIDIWALGITLIELAETAPPLSYINPMRALFQIPARDPPTLEKKQKWSPNFHDFLSKCLEKNPKKRPSAVVLMNVCYFTFNGDDVHDDNCGCLMLMM
jgi:serine/threonine protein kinase